MRTKRTPHTPTAAAALLADAIAVLADLANQDLEVADAHDVSCALGLAASAHLALANLDRAVSTQLLHRAG